jgi:hypothetical protein
MTTGSYGCSFGVMDLSIFKAEFNGDTKQKLQRNAQY